MEWSLSNIFFYSVLSVLTVCVGGFVHIVLEEEKEEYWLLSHIKTWQLYIKLFYKLLKHRKQGELKFHKSLVYIGEAGDERYGLKIEPRNHKITVKRLRFDKKEIEAYKKLTGVDSSDGYVPVCYPETLFLKLLFTLITSRKFCLSPLGLIHIRQTILQNDQLEDYIAKDLAGEASVLKYRKGKKGVEVDIRLRLFAIGQRGSVWEGVVTLLSRSGSRSQDGQGQYSASPCEHAVDIAVEGKIGIKYAKLTGDWNPHHLYPWSAWLLGYKGPIAHGMWSLARAISQVHSHDASIAKGKFEVSCSFKCPLYLPGRMRIQHDDLIEVYSRTGCRLLVDDVTNNAPHIVATLKSL